MITERQIWLKKNFKLFRIIIVISGLSTLITTLFLDSVSIIILVVSGMLSIFYVGRFLFKRVTGLRDLPHLKAYVIAMAWTLSVAFLPIRNNFYTTSDSNYLISVAVFLFIFSLAILFDVRDMNIDSHKQRTIPKILGKKGAVFMALTCLFIATLLMLLFDKELLIPLTIILSISVTLFLLALRRTDDFFYSFWLDGLIYLPAILLLIGSFIDE